jgi:tetraacyldisaccharide 4'-kinase
VLVPLALPASWIYRTAVAARNRRFDRGVGVARFAFPVISIGNITTGGTGKTPIVAWTCQALRAAGRHPVIAMRGYAARHGESSDEQAEYAQRLPAVPVVAAADRVAALNGVLPSAAERRGSDAWPEIDCIVLDDGFQHRRIARDLDIVLIDATQDTFADRLLPAGRLREPLENLRRAGAVIVTRAERVDEQLAEAIGRFQGRQPVAWTRHTWTALRLHDARGSSAVSVQWLRGKRVVTLLGVGNPRAVASQVESAAVAEVRNLPASDHQRYDRAWAARIRSRCEGFDALLTTAKDWVKLAALLDLSRLPAPVVIPELAIEFLAGESALRRRIESAVATAAGKPVH